MTYPSAAETPVQPGEILAGKYRVERVLGRGGMGVVVAATQLDLGRTVALKFMLSQAMSDADTVARFFREARIVAGLRSEHIAVVHDLGKLDSGAPYMVMEYLEGMDLGRLLAQRGPLPFTEAASYVRQACEAIAEAHGHGVIHRDLKPANLFLTTRPNGTPLVKVLDFGISKGFKSDTNNHAMTRTTSVMGSPYYMSPEQMAQPRTVDLRTDIWSLGVILYELATQNVPFQGDTLAELVLKVHQQEPPPMNNWRPETPAAYQALVARCLQKDRNRRFDSAADLAAALALDSAAVPSGHTMLAPIRWPEGQPSEALRGSMARSNEGWTGTIAGRRSSSRTVLMAAAALALVGGAFFFITRLRSGHEDTSGNPRVEKTATTETEPVIATAPAEGPSAAAPTAELSPPSPIASAPILPGSPIASPPPAILQGARTPGLVPNRPAGGIKPVPKPKPAGPSPTKREDDLLQP